MPSVTARWLNKRDLPGGCEMLLALHDASGTYADRQILKSFRGKTVADCTDAFLLSVAKLEGARIIQEKILSDALATIQGLAQTQYVATVQPAMNTAKTNVQGQLSANNCTPAQIRTRILNAWSSYGVSNVLGDPTVSIPFSLPDQQDFSIDVQAVNG